MVMSRLAGGLKREARKGMQGEDCQRMCDEMVFYLCVLELECVSASCGWKYVCMCNVALF